MSAEDLAAIYADWEEFRPRYERGWQFYKGRQREFFASAKARALLQKAGVEDMDRFNFAAIPVDTVIDRMHISGVTVAGSSSKVLDAISGIAEDNQLEAEEQVLLQYLGAMGEVIEVVLPVDDDPLRPSGVAVNYWDPRRARILYDPLDPLRKTAGVLTWESGKDKTRADLYYADGTLERWEGKGSTEKLKRATAWTPWSGEDADGGELPETEVLDFGDNGLPFFHYRTGRPEAEPLHRKAFGPQQGIDKIIVAHLATIDVASFPQRYGQIDPNADWQSAGTSANPFHPGNGDDDDPESESNVSQAAADPGHLLKLKGYTTVGQFAVAGADVFMSPLDRYVRAMAQVTRIPMHYFDPSGDSPSGESLKVSDAPINHRVKTLKTMCGAVQEDAWRCALSFAGAGDDLDVDVRWAPHETATDLAAWQTIAAKVAAGVPVRVVLTQDGGYDPDEVDSWLSDLNDSGEIGRQIAMLGQLGDALTKIAQAQALGLQADVSGLVDELLQAMDEMWSQREADPA